EKAKSSVSNASAGCSTFTTARPLKSYRFFSEFKSQEHALRCRMGMLPRIFCRLRTVQLQQTCLSAFDKSSRYVKKHPLSDEIRTVIPAIPPDIMRSRSRMSFLALRDFQGF